MRDSGHDTPYDERDTRDRVGMSRFSGPLARAELPSLHTLFIRHYQSIIMSTTTMEKKLVAKMLSSMESAQLLKWVLDFVGDEPRLFATRLLGDDDDGCEVGGDTISAAGGSSKKRKATTQETAGVPPKKAPASQSGQSCRGSIRIVLSGFTGKSGSSLTSTSPKNKMIRAENTRARIIRIVAFADKYDWKGRGSARFRRDYFSYEQSLVRSHGTQHVMTCDGD